MKLTVSLAGTNIAILFLGKTLEVAPLYEHIYRDFRTKAKKSEATLKVSFLPEYTKGSCFWLAKQEFADEKVIPTREVAAWLGKQPNCEAEDLVINERTICSAYLDGLLVYCPDHAAGQIFLPKQALQPFRPLYRLLWVFFSQVLGERGSCFLHAAALVKDGKGYVFLGESGAGKSTLTRLSRDCLVFSDDSPIARKENGGYRVYPSPYHQLGHDNGLDKEVIYRSAQIKGFYFLKKKEQVFLETLSNKEAFSEILTQHIHFFPCISKKARLKLFDTFWGACEALPTYNIYFNRDQDVFAFVTGN